MRLLKVLSYLLFLANPLFMPIGTAQKVDLDPLALYH
jgi:hypothetical protein